MPTIITEDWIERRVEHKMDDLDRRFTTTAMTQETYDKLCREIDEWAKSQYLLVGAPLVED